MKQMRGKLCYDDGVSTTKNIPSSPGLVCAHLGLIQLEPYYRYSHLFLPTSQYGPCGLQYIEEMLAGELILTSKQRAGTQYIHISLIVGDAKFTTRTLQVASNSST